MKIIIFLALLSAYFGLLWATYRKGRSDERFSQDHCCSDCGDLREDNKDGMCIDCRRKLWGEIREDGK